MYKTAAWVAMAALALSAGAACKKKDKTEAAGAAGSPAAPATETAPEVAAPAPDPAKAAEEAKEEAEREAAGKQQKKELLEYSTMEDRYLNDPKGQWASAAKASSSFSSAGKEPADSQASNTPWQATAAPNGNAWTNDNQNMGIDWLELTYATPVAATEVRAVLLASVGALSKVELIDEAGTPHEVWNGTDEVKPDSRGPRTWFVHTFDKSPYKVAKAKLSFANAVSSGYKEVDAVQLIGE